MKSHSPFVIAILLTLLLLCRIRLFQKPASPFNVVSSSVKLERIYIPICLQLGKCAPSLESSLHSSIYSKEEQYILSALSRTNPSTHGFIVFKENEAFGIGNVYRSFASVLLLAIVTNRTLFGILVNSDS